MKSTRLTIDAARVYSAVSDLIGSVQPITSVHSLPVVEICGDRIDIIDGYHRIAGLIAGGAETIECVTCDCADTIGDAANAERPAVQREALRRIYAAL